ncbi:MAG: tetratricopeptide repeat protein [Nitrospiraceae bacterium]
MLRRWSGRMIGWAAVCLALLGCAPTVPTTNNPKVVEATKLDKEGQSDAALAALDQAIRINPDDSVAWNDRGHLYIKKNLFDRAIADYSHAIALKEAGLYYANRGTAKVLKGLYDEAISDFNKAEEMRYREPSAMTLRGKAYFEKGRHQEALKDFTGAIESDPNQVAAYGLRGKTFVLLGRYSEALPDLERYLQANPDDALALALQGQAFIKSGNVDRAKDKVRRLIEVEPRLATNFSGDRALDLYDLDKRRAVVKQSLVGAKEAVAIGQWQKAFDHFERARTYMTGQTAQDRADHNMILEGVRRSYAKLSAKPELPETARRFGVQAVRVADQKEYDRAVQFYGKALGVAYWWPEAHFNRALILAEQAHFEEAIVEMKAFLELAPTAPDIRAAQDKIYEWELKGR